MNLILCNFFFKKTKTLVKKQKPYKNLSFKNKYIQTFIKWLLNCFLLGNLSAEQWEYSLKTVLSSAADILLECAVTMRIGLSYLEASSRIVNHPSSPTFTIHTPDQVHKYLWLVKLVWHQRQKIFFCFSSSKKMHHCKFNICPLSLQRNGIGQKVWPENCFWKSIAFAVIYAVGRQS